MSYDDGYLGPFIFTNVSSCDHNMHAVCSAGSVYVRQVVTDCEALLCFFAIKRHEMAKSSEPQSLRHPLYDIKGVTPQNIVYTTLRRP